MAANLSWSGFNWATPQANFISQDFVVSATHMNHGDIGVDYSGFIACLSPDAVWDMSDSFVLVSGLVGLTPGASYRSNVDEAAHLQSGPLPGDYYMLVVADADNYIDEEDQTDNLLAIGFTILPTSDLVPTAHDFFETPPLFFRGDGTETLSLTVSDEPAPAYVRIGVDGTSADYVVAGLCARGIRTKARRWSPALGETCP
ncbi:CARDB domain-containing protein [Chachezhania sediminis]|uniref:CARDB domain-containing protein n=1 Tax=Chachezhania sediminis TaxID=2599291 RepID=UPI00131D0E9A|nr:CARDB domain-containing protein [Chachezhania sediminis]